MKNAIFLNWNVYNQREKQRNAKRIIEMEGKTTVIYDPENGKEEKNHKKFTFDHSYWSHDGFTEAENGLCLADDHHRNGYKYIDQVNNYFTFNLKFINRIYFVNVMMSCTADELKVI